MDQETLIRLNLQPLRLDAMPAEVATEYLTTPGLKMSASFRRKLHAARASYYVSTNKPKDTTTRFSTWRIDRLHRMRRRTQIRIRMTQSQLNKIKVESIHEQVVQTVMLPLIAAGNAVSTEIERRQTNIAALAAKKNAT